LFAESFAQQQGSVRYRQQPSLTANNALGSGNLGIWNFAAVRERLFTQEAGSAIAHRWEWVYILGRPETQNGNSG
jgi:hypothetical protein